MGRFLNLLLIISCLVFISCRDYHKEKIKTIGVVQEVILKNNCTILEPKTQIRVKIDSISNEVYFSTNKNIQIGDTIDLEIIYYRKPKDNILNYNLKE